MPKKFSAVKTKAVEANARKNEKKKALEEQKQKEIEDEYWKDDDKNNLKKMQRKEEKDKKRQELIDKKHELQRLADEEMNNLSKSTVKSNLISTKITRLQIVNNQENAAKLNKSEVKPEKKLVDEITLEENLNKIVFEGDVAQTVETAIELLSGKDTEVDFHPEKRVKAAYIEYEAIHLPILKQDNPNLRLSQLKQILRKDWNKSSENPLNQTPILE